MKEITREGDALKKKAQNLIFTVALILCAGSLAFVVWSVYSYWQETNQKLQQAKEDAKKEAVEAVKKIDENLRKLQETATTIASDLTAGNLNDQQLPDRLKSAMEKNPNLFGVGGAYTPYAYDPKVRLYMPYRVNKDGQVRYTTETFYDYTQPEHQWFNRPIAEGKGIWQETYQSQKAGEMVLEFSVPFYRNLPANPQQQPEGDEQETGEQTPATQEKKPAGVIYANYSWDDIKAVMASLKLGQTGYGFIVSKKGVFIAHPIKDYVIQGKTIFDLAQKQKNDQLRILGERASQGESGVIELKNTITGLSAWIFYEPIPSTGWTMGVVFFQKEALADADILQRKQHSIFLVTLAFLFFLSVLGFRAYTGTPRRLWALVYSCNVLCVTAIGFFWYLARTDRSYENNSDTKILLVSEDSVNNFLNYREQLANQSKQPKPIYIPTGLFVQSLEFETANNVTITGYIWQKYTKGIHDDVTRGFVLPEAVDEVEATESYKRQEGNVEIIGWYFKATLRQKFDYSKYPLDYKDVWIRLWAKDFDKNVILVPDFSAYDLIHPKAKPGIEKDLVLSEWDIDSSFFQYYLNSYNTNFGLANYYGDKNFPELYFTILIKRDLLPIVISDLIPLAVVYLLLFAYLSLTSQDAEVSPKDLIEVSAGLLFAALLNQINLRNAIAAQGIIYLEYFYLVFYLIVLLVIVNALLSALSYNISWLKGIGNLSVRLLYWPTLLGLLLFITAVVFW
jgi:hypothetical protein